MSKKVPKATPATSPTSRRFSFTVGGGGQSAERWGSIFLAKVEVEERVHSFLSTMDLVPREVCKVGVGVGADDPQ